MSLKKVFKADPIKEKAGVWISVSQGEGSPDCEFLVAPTGPSNKKYTAALQASQKKYKHTFKTMSSQRLNEIFVEVFVDTVLLDWKNVEEYRDDQPKGLMAFNKENAKFLLTDLPEVLELLSREAGDFSNFVANQTEVDAKN